jgi:hypothetical protein
VNFGPAFGAATIDGVVDDAVEWSGASSQTFVMESPSTATPLTVTLRIMNDATHLYLGLTIADDEFSTVGQFLPEGDSFRVDFDNDHSGVLFEPGDDVLVLGAGSPQFVDGFIVGDPARTSVLPDVSGGGTTNGAAAASRVGNLNHFEGRHPLCSGDSRDFCLQPSDVVGFRLEYFDAEADGSFGGTLLFPGFDDTSVADIVLIVPHSIVFLPVVVNE